MSLNNFTEFANREVCNCVFQDYLTKNYFLNCESANTTTLDVTGESVFAYGGQGHPKKVTFYGEKGGQFKIETQMQTIQLYSLLTGAAIESSAKWLKRVVKTTPEGDTSITLTEAAAAGSVVVYKADDDCGTPLKITYDGTTKTITGSTEAPLVANTTYIIYYLVDLNTNVKKLAIKTTTFPKAFTMYGETFSKTENDQIIAQKMIAYKLQPQNNFSINWSNTGDPATITITCDIMADKDGNMLDLITMEEDNE